MKSRTGNRPAEAVVVKAVIKYLKRIGLRDVRTEAQFGERFLDIYARSARSNRYVAVEAKVFSPTKAFSQASQSLPLAQSVYVAEWCSKANATAKGLAARTGIGLIVVSRDSLGRVKCKLEVPPVPSPYFSPELAKLIWKRSTNNTRVTLS